MSYSSFVFLAITVAVTVSEGDHLKKNVVFSPHQVNGQAEPRGSTGRIIIKV